MKPHFFRIIITRNCFWHKLNLGGAQIWMSGKAPAPPVQMVCLYFTIRWSFRWSKVALIFCNLDSLTDQGYTGKMMQTCVMFTNGAFLSFWSWILKHLQDFGDACIWLKYFSKFMKYFNVKVFVLNQVSISV